MSRWSRAGIQRPAVRAAVAVLVSLLLVLSGATTDVVEAGFGRDEAPASSSVAAADSDDCAACASGQRVPRPGRVGRPAGGGVRPPVPTASSAGEGGGLSGLRAAPLPDSSAAAPPARHSVLRC
ncbi:hypothetical protein AB0K09_16705 [Streptomyces sp. NPDC049577]|uniref:hypothetical protein n=1 Tax=Streptomyces sp. NPDC049577 TaxID=3155153 RepID=UPI00343B97F2